MQGFTDVGGCHVEEGVSNVCHVGFAQKYW
jgi:hypothetical protein